MASRGSSTVAVEVGRALRAGEIVLHFQPKTELAGGAIRGVEALARCRHPVRPLLGAAELLAAVDGAGLMEDFTDHVLELALAQRSAWAREGLELAVAVNVSPSSVLGAGFADRVAAALRRHGAPANALGIELTESVIMLDHEAATAVLGRLRTLGVGLSIDDFGTGWSSLARLRHLPFDEI